MSQHLAEVLYCLSSMWFMPQDRCGQLAILLRSEILSGKCTKLHTVVASNNRGHPMRSLYYFLFTPHIYIVVLHAHPLRGESQNQRYANGKVATTSPPFYNEPHRLHVLFVKASHSTTSASWSQHHFVVIGNPERQVRKASHCGSKQQWRSPNEITVLLLVRATYIYCYSSRTPRLW